LNPLDDAVRKEERGQLITGLVIGLQYITAATQISQGGDRHKTGT